MARGFSLIEIIVALLLVALIVAIAIPSINSMTGVELKRAAAEFRSVLRDVYTTAALSSQTCRLVISMDDGKYWTELAKEDKPAPKKDESDSDQDDEDKLVVKKLFAPAKGDLGKKQSLANGLQFTGFWAEHMKERQKKGVQYLYFFPGGYAEAAQISMAAKSSKDSYTIVTDPLTGNADILNEEPAIPRDSP